MSVMEALRRAVRQRGGTVDDTGHVTSGDTHITHVYVSGLEDHEVDYVMGYTRSDDETVQVEQWGDGWVFTVDRSVER
jgi:hypothetical protein